jgi:Cu+-exporting ATPase
MQFAQLNEEVLIIEKGAVIMKIDSACGMQIYKLKTQKMILPVKGMSCTLCGNHVLKVLNGVAGVIHASINYATEKASICYVSGRISVEDLTRVIESTGRIVPEIGKIGNSIKNK